MNTNRLGGIYKICPKCLCRVSKPGTPSIQGLTNWTLNSSEFRCWYCNGWSILPIPPIELGLDND